MGVISKEQSDRLYWLGRYTERVYTTLRVFSKSYDKMIDETEDSYPDYCRRVDIPNIYTSKMDFLTRYPFDITVPDSIISNLTRAYDNAIVLRESIGSETLSYIQLAIYEMNKASQSEAPLIELQKVIDNILAFWGIADDQIDSEEIRNTIKAGKRIERIDMYARLGEKRSVLMREVHRMKPRVQRSGKAYDVERISELETLLMITPLDYYSIVEAADSIF